MNRWLHSSRLSRQLRRKVRAYYEFAWSHSAAELEREILEGLPPVLRKPCAMNVHKAIIDQVPFLRDMGDECTSQLITMFRLVHVEAGEYVFVKGEIGNAMFIVKDGEVEVIVSEDEPPKARLPVSLSARARPSPLALLSLPTFLSSFVCSGHCPGLAEPKT